MKFYICQKSVMKNPPKHPPFLKHIFNIKKRNELYSKYYTTMLLEKEVEDAVENELKACKEEIQKNITKNFKIVEVECGDEINICDEIFIITKKYYVEYFDKDDELKHINYFGIRVLKTVLH